MESISQDIILSCSDVVLIKFWLGYEWGPEVGLLQDGNVGSSRFCVISLTYIGSIDLCVLCVFVVRSTPSLGEMYLRIHFTHQSWESRKKAGQIFQ